MTIEHCPPSPEVRGSEGLPSVAAGHRLIGKATLPRSGWSVSVRGLAALCLGVVGLTSCGGSNPLDNPATVSNPGSVGGQKLSFLYFETCINPIFDELLPIPGTTRTNTCSGAGCHDNVAGTGGAFRVVPAAQPVDITLAANTPAVIRATADMYKNFYSAQGEVDVSTPAQSRLLIKPLVQGVLHGGGLVFSGVSDPHVKLIQYWITHPAPIGQDEFSTASYSMFTPPFDPQNPQSTTAANCNTQ